MQLEGYLDPGLPQRTHLKSVSNAVGESCEPFRQQSCNTYASMLEPRSMTILPGCPNPASAKGISERYLQLMSKSTGAVGKSHVTFGMMIAVNLTSKHWSSNVVTDCSGGLCYNPLIPET